MSILEIKSKESCQYDLVALGEVMLRLDPGEGRIRCARQSSMKMKSRRYCDCRPSLVGLANDHAKALRREGSASRLSAFA